MSFRILGTGKALPEFVLTNQHLSTFLDTSDEWITTRTGIKERRILTDRTITDLAISAAREALADAAVAPEELDMLLCATISGDYLTPSLACLVQREIGAKCPAYDINAACSGFIYALDAAAGYFARKKAKKVLVIAIEAMSRLADWQDRTTCVLFGDGGGAVVLGEGDDLLSIFLSAQGNADILNIPGHGGNCPFQEKEKEESFLYMNGQEVYKFAVNAICHDLRFVVNEAGITEDDVTYVLPHQANMRIIEAAQHRLGIAKDKYVTTIAQYGNTSAGSIPLILDNLNKSGKLKNGDLLAMSAFGGGLTTGACLLRWNK